MGQRSRKRRRAGGGAAPAPGPPRASSAERAERARADLAPLTPGDRPTALLVAVCVATLLGLANIALYLVGTKVPHGYSGPGVISFSAVMLVAAVGMYRLRYWAVLGFQALLALIVLTFGLFLVRASNVEALLLCLVVMGSGGWLFWKMVRVMARIQMPERPSR